MPKLERVLEDHSTWNLRVQDSRKVATNQMVYHYPKFPGIRAKAVEGWVLVSFKVYIEYVSTNRTIKNRQENSVQGY